MPITNGNYTAPEWTNLQAPGINDTELLAMSQTLEKSQILTGNEAPTVYTEGNVGQFYVDKSTDPWTIYQCRAASGGSYTWEADEGDSFNLALPYDDTETYGEGNYCLYSGVLYRAVTDIETPEAWNSDHWVRIYLANDLEAHIADTANPHHVTKAQVGLGNVANEAQYSPSNPPIKAGSMVLQSGGWSGGPDIYTQAASVIGASVTNKSMVDLKPTADQRSAMAEDGVETMMVRNSGGTLTAFSVGAAPSTSMTMQCTVEEVDTNETSIWGNGI